MSVRLILERGGRVAAAVLLVLALPLGADGHLDPIRDLDARGQTREALERLEREHGVASREPEVDLLRGVLLAKLGRTAEARELYQRLILEHPELPEAYNNLAVMHAAAGDYDTAIEILKRGLATHPSYRTTYDNLTKVYGKLAGEAYSKALGDERIDAEPLRLALINDVAQVSPVAGGTQSAAVATPAAAPPDSPIVPAPEPQAESAVAPEPPPEPLPAPAAASGSSDQELWQTVQSWADAWAGQRVEEYLSFYAGEFTPAGGGSRADWESLRRRRLEAPEYVKLSLALLEIERPADGRAVVRFVQSYESDRFRDTVTKALEMVHTGGGWRIVRETVEGSAR